LCRQYLHATVGCSYYSAKATYKEDAHHAANDSACAGNLYRLQLAGPIKATYKGSLHLHHNHTITLYQLLPTDPATAFENSVSSKALSRMSGASVSLEASTRMSGASMSYDYTSIE
jgi:hypothetical protein